MTLLLRVFPGNNGTEGSLVAVRTRVFEAIFGRLERDQSPRAGIWAMEKVEGRGLHVHCLLHLGPNPDQEAKALKAYVCQTFGVPESSIDFRLGDNGGGCIWPEQRAHWVRYMFKPTHHGGEYVGGQTLGAFLGVPDKGPQGFMSIKRCGLTEGIGPAERARAGWEDINTPDALKAALHPPTAAELKARGYVATPTGCALIGRAA